MRQYRLGVRCKSCGQPIVLNDTPPGMLDTSTRARQTRRLHCVSCGRRASYELDAFRVFETAEISSGDWEAVPERRLGAGGRAHQ
jgi:DNA-directed RNA polymerase subunit N (RpoN/RPB10)